MDAKIFWLVVFVLIGLIGTILTFARRYKNQDSSAGLGIAGWTIVFLLLWLVRASKLLN